MCELASRQHSHCLCIHTHIDIYIDTHTHLLFSFLFHCSLLSFAHSVFPWQIKSHSAAWHTIQRNPFNFQTPTADPFSVFLCKEGLRFWIVTITLYSPIISFLLYRWYLTDNTVEKWKCCVHSSFVPFVHKHTQSRVIDHWDMLSPTLLLILL